MTNKDSILSRESTEFKIAGYKHTLQIAARFF